MYGHVEKATRVTTKGGRACWTETASRKSSEKKQQAWQHADCRKLSDEQLSVARGKERRSSYGGFLSTPL
ncbi:hypothetical protein DL769_004306 [Monosporascus sp. CRB-8-3]|nr:hypothetical protein DL769_004306 [Monosporascus sp. CRB-8-3]